MTEATATAERERTGYDVVRRGAGLNDGWTDERIGAVRKLLPGEYRGVNELIAALTLADRYQLDPFAGEIFFVEDKGRMIVIVPRDGLIAIARRDKRVTGIQADIVFDGDNWNAEESAGGKITIEHKRGMSRFAPDAKPIGAYCMVKMEGDEPDQLITRRFSDYSHLAGKANWKQYGQDMILARVVSAALRLKTSLSGVYTEGDFALQETATSPDQLVAEVVDMIDETTGPFDADPDAGEASAGEALRHGLWVKLLTMVDAEMAERGVAWTEDGLFALLVDEYGWQEPFEVDRIREVSTKTGLKKLVEDLIELIGKSDD